MYNLIFATHNQHKVEEASFVFGADFSLQSLKDINYHKEIIEDGKSFEENALIKSRTIWKHFKKACFAEDSGLVVDALNGTPGIYSARYASKENSSLSNNDLLLRKLQTQQNRDAYFITVLSFINEKGEESCFEGRLHGKIAKEKNGEFGFGYDPIFIPDSSTETLAQLGPSYKQKYSHRAQAMQRFIAFMTKA